MKRSIALFVTGVAVSLSLVGCGEDEPAVCSSVDSLKSSVDDVKDVDVTAEGGVASLKDSFEAVQTDLATVREDAKSEFADQIAAVETSYAAAQVSVEAAETSPTADTLSAVGTALTTFVGNIETLVDDIQATC